MQQRSRNRQTLAHPARECPHQASRSRGKSAGCKRLCRTSARIAEAIELCKEVEIFFRRHLVVEKSTVANEADESPRIFRFRSSPGQSDAAGRRFHQLRCHTQQSRLPCSVCSEQAPQILRHESPAKYFSKRRASQSASQHSQMQFQLNFQQARIRRVGNWRAVRPRRSAQPRTRLRSVASMRSRSRA